MPAQRGRQQGPTPQCISRHDVEVAVVVDVGAVHFVHFQAKIILEDLRELSLYDTLEEDAHNALRQSECLTAFPENMRMIVRSVRAEDLLDKHVDFIFCRRWTQTNQTKWFQFDKINVAYPACKDLPQLSDLGIIVSAGRFYDYLVSVLANNLLE